MSAHEQLDWEHLNKVAQHGHWIRLNALVVAGLTWVLVTYSFFEPFFATALTIALGCVIVPLGVNEWKALK